MQSEPLNNDPNTAGRGVVPPSVVATPAQMSAEVGERIPWWRPGWRDVIPFVGYRWVFLSPVVLVAVAGIWFWIGGGPRDLLLVVGVKMFVTTAAIAIALAGYVIRRAIQARKEPFCIFCGYNLTGLPDGHRCPECGRSISWAVIAEYRRDPQWFIERWKAHRELPPASEPFHAGVHARRKRARDGTE